MLYPGDKVKGAVCQLFVSPSPRNPRGLDLETLEKGSMMKKLPLLLLFVTLLAWTLPAAASEAQDSDSTLAVEVTVAERTDGAPGAEVEGSELAPSPESELALFQSFERKLAIIVATNARGCAIMECNTHDDCQGNGSCHRCCFGICMAD